MTKQESTYTLKLDAEIKSLTDKAESVKRALNQIGAVGKFPELDKGLEKVFKRLSHIKEIASSPVSSSTFKNLDKDAAQIGLHLTELLNTLTNIAKNTDGLALNILPADMLSKLEKARSAIDAYDNAIAETSKRTKEMIDADNALAQASGKVASWKNKLADAENAKAMASESLAVSKAELQATEERIAATKKEVEEKKKAIAELEQLYESSGTDKRRNIIDGSGNTRNLIKEKKQLTKAENSITTDEATVEELHAHINSGEKAIKTYSDRITECTSSVGNWEVALARCTEQLRLLEESFEASKLKNTQNAYKALRQEAEKLGIDISDLPLEGTGEDMEKLKSRVEALDAEISQLAVSTIEGAKGAFEGYDTVINNFKRSTDLARESSEKFQETQQQLTGIKDNIKRFVGWAGAAKALSAALRNAFQDIKQLDEAMTEIAVVTDFDISDMWSQLPEYTERANQLGLSITSVYEASALFYQQGLNTNEMVALSNETLKMAKIAGLSAADATDRMTAALRGFNMELNETSAQKVSDVYSKLAAITASDVNEISKAMTKTASIASSAGMEFETTAAFLSQIIETTRESAETAGTAMKTVIARFQELKKSPEEIEAIDGEMVDANGIERALRSVGVSLRDASGQFRELDEVFLDLSSKWNTLDKNTQRYIATIAAGSRQQSRFIAMMQDYERTQELVDAANTSAGASSIQYAKTLESIETKLAKLENAWTEFSTGLMNSEFVKGALDFLTALLNGLNKATQGFGGFTSSLSKVGTLVAIFQTAKTVVTKFFDKLIQQIYLSSKAAGENIGKGTQEGLAHAAVSAAAAPRKGSKFIAGFKTVATQSKTLSADREKLKQTREAAIESEKKYKQQITELADDKEALAKAQADRVLQLEKEAEALKNAEEPLNNAIKGIDQMTESAQATAQALVLVGAGISMIGDAVAQSGAEEAGEVISKIGSGVTLIGSTLVALVPIISLVAKQIAAQGVQAMLPWLGIVLIIAAVAATVAIIANQIKKASPEYKLEKLAEASEKAAAAAELAESAYEGLVNSLESLEEGYKTIENLTRGTVEWNKAVRDLNSQVLDLVNQYPELAKYVKSEQGVLRLDISAEKMDEVLAKAERRAILARNNQIMADAAVTNAQNNVSYKNLTNSAKLDQTSANWSYGGTLAASIVAGAGAGAGVGALVGTVAPVIGNAIGAVGGAIVGAIGGLIGGLKAADAVRDQAYQDTQKATENLAKALAEGSVVKDEEQDKYVIKDAEKAASRGLTESVLEDYYDQVGESTTALITFGRTLLTAEEQTKTAFAAVAENAKQLADTLGFTDQEKNQMDNLISEATAETLKQNKMDELEDIDFTNEDGWFKGMSDEEQSLRDEAIQAQYGEGSRIEGSTVYYRDEKGQQQTEELTSDEIKEIIASQYATTESIRLANSIPELATDAATAIAASKGWTSEEQLGALEALLEDQTGGELTYGQLQNLQGLDSTTMTNLWNGLSSDLQLMFGSVESFIAKTSQAYDNASQSFAWSESVATDLGINLNKDFQSGVLKGYTTHLEEMFYRSGADKAVAQNFDLIYDTFIEQSEKSEEVAARINAADWTNTESLLALQYDLAESYGYSLDEAKAFVGAIGDATQAVSGLTGVLDNFGKFFKATQEIERALNKVEDAEWQYQKALTNQDYKTATKAREEIKEALYDSIDSAIVAAREAEYRTAQTYANGAAVIPGRNLSQYVSFDEETQSFDFTEFNEYIKTLNEEDKKKAEEWASELVENNKIAREQLETAKDSYDKLEQLLQESKEAYNTLKGQVAELIITERKQLIDIQKDVLAATKEAGENVVASIDKQIEATRRERENTKTEKDIAKIRNQISLLSMDTSGANSLEILDLQDQLGEAEQDYQDTLIDQALQELQDANQAAFDQRERQIALMEDQLESYQISNDFYQEIENTLTEYYAAYQEAQERGITFNPADTVLGARFQTAMTKGMNQSDADEYMQNIGANTATGAEWYDSNVIGNVSQGNNSMSSALSKIVGGLALDSGTLTTMSNNINTAVIAALNGQAMGGATSLVRSLEDQAGVNNLGSMGSEIVAYLSGANPSSRYDAATNSYKGGLTSTQITELQTKYGGANPTAETTISGITSALTDIENLQRLKGLDDSTAKDLANRFESLNAAQKAVVSSSRAGFQTKEQYYNSFTADDWDQLTYQILMSDKGGADAALLWENYYADSANYTRALQTMSASIGTPVPLKWDWDGDEGNAKIWSAGHIVGSGEYNWKGGKVSVTKASGDVSSRLNTAIDYYGGIYNHAIWDGTDLYIRESETSTTWFKVKQRNSNNKDAFESLVGAAKTYANATSGTYKSGGVPTYKIGGLADFTGPAWLDGTPEKPEYILNAAQTERFFSLIDVLENYDTKTKADSRAGGDNYYDIDITVEKLEKDYDIEKIADKIRRMLYEDATYRNVNSINRLR